MNADDWDRRYSGKELLWTAEANRFVVAEIDGMEPGVALDLAAGEGRNSVWLAEHGWDATAVDFSPAAMARAEKLAASREVSITCVTADLMTFQPEPERFDLVVIAYLHVPWPQMEHVLGLARTALAPGGTLLLVGHDADNIEHGYGGPPNPAVLYTAAQVAAALPGLVIDKAERVDRRVQTDDGDKVALDCLVRARRPA